MRIWPYLLLLVAGVGWGVSFPLAELALPEVAPTPLLLLRFGVASAVCLPLALRSAHARAAFRDPWVWAMGGLYAASFILQFEGLARANVTLAALLVGFLPALVAMAAPWLGEKVRALGWAGVAAATLGAVLIAVGPGTGRSGSGVSGAGVALMIASLVLNLGWLLAARRVRPNPDPIAAPCASILIATLTILLVDMPLHGPPPLALSPAAWVGVAGTGIVSTAVATIAWVVGSPRVASTTSGVFIALEPVIGAVAGVLAFHDPLTPAIAAGGLLIVGGSLAVVLAEQPSGSAPAPEPS